MIRLAAFRPHRLPQRALARLCKLSAHYTGEFRCWGDDALYGLQKRLWAANRWLRHR